MKKAQVNDFFYMLMIASLALLGAGCGAGKKSGAKADPNGEEQVEPPKSLGPTSNPSGEPSDKAKTPVQADPSQATPTAQGGQTPAQTGTQATPAAGSHPLEGTYVQVENEQARIVIVEGLLLSTNLEFSPPAGSGTRLTPAFPHGLRYQASTDEYWTIGTYNDGTSVFRNIEIRLRLHNQNKLLDVTLIPYLNSTSTGSGSGSGSGGSQGGSSSSGYGSSGSVSGGGTVTVSVHCLSSGSHGTQPVCPPPPPLPPPLPLPLPPPPSYPAPCPNPCPSDGNQLRYLYLFKRK